MVAEESAEHHDTARTKTKTKVRSHAKRCFLKSRLLKLESRMADRAEPLKVENGGTGVTAGKGMREIPEHSCRSGRRTWYYGVELPLASLQHESPTASHPTRKRRVWGCDTAPMPQAHCPALRASGLPVPRGWSGVCGLELERILPHDTLPSCKMITLGTAEYRR